MFDYVRGLLSLKKSIPDEALETYSILEARLLENLQNADLYGATPTGNADKNTIISGLNKLAFRYGAKSFNDMCLDQPAKATLPSSSEIPKQDLATPQALPVWQAISEKTKIDLLAPIVPTAYCKDLNVEAFPLLRVTVDTTDPRSGDTTLQIYTWIEDYSDEDVKPVSLAAGNMKEVLLFPLFKHDAVRKLNDVRVVTLHIHIKQTKPVLDEYEETKRVRLLSYDTALLALEMKNERVVDLSCYLSAWVTPRDQSIKDFLKTVINYHDEHELDGYPDSDTTTDPVTSVRKQVQAVYNALKFTTKLAYTDTSFVSGNPNEQIVQHVKLPSETLATGYGNCLDGTVLFASILKAMSLQPLIMLEREHAYLGWKIAVRGEGEHLEFLETTLIGTNDFSEAHQRGMERYQFALAHGWLKHKINDRSGYLRSIDVTYWHGEGIHPLA